MPIPGAPSILLGALLLVVTSAACGGAAQDLVTEADRLARADDVSADMLRRAVALYERAAQTDTRNAAIQIKLAAAWLELGARVDDDALPAFHTRRRRRSVRCSTESGATWSAT